MMKKYKFLFLIILTGFITFGCTEQFLEENPPHILVADNLYVDEAGFQSGLNAIYSNVRQERDMLNEPSQFAIVYALGGTDVITGTYWYDDLNVFGDQITPENPMIYDLWSLLYSIINASNTIIDRAGYPDVELTTEQKNRITAEARFFRAYAYRHLSFLWGDVPLNLQEVSGSNIKTDWSRNSIAEVRAQIIDDLEFASENLPGTPNDYASNITNWVAKHFLAEMYLTVGENEKAEQVSQDVVSNSPYELVTERYGVNATNPGTAFTDMFLEGNINRAEGNSEVMWSYQVEYLVTGGGATFNRRVFLMRYDKLGLGVTKDRGGRGKGYLGATAYMHSLYTPEDDRGSEFAWRKYYILREEAKDKLKDGMEYGDTLWLQTSEEDQAFQNVQWSSTRKFDDAIEENLSSSDGFNDYSNLRLAATYLLLAEAKFKNGDKDGAASVLNVLRARANASPIAADDVTLKFILEESARELFGEDHRKYTLLRNNIWKEYTNNYNKLVENRATDRDMLLPIPQIVIDANIDRVLEQNPDY